MARSRFYDAGYDDHGEGSELADNPFDEGTIEHEEWDSGWHEANMNEMGAYADDYFENDDEWEDDNDDE